MNRVDIYEPYVNFRWQKLHSSMSKMAQSDWSRDSPRFAKLAVQPPLTWHMCQNLNPGQKS